MTKCVCNRVPDPPCISCICKVLPFSDVDLSADVTDSHVVNESNLLKTLLEQEIFSPYEPLKDIFSDHQEFDPDYNYYNTINLNCNYFLEEDYLDQKVKQNLY